MKLYPMILRFSLLLFTLGCLAAEAQTWEIMSHRARIHIFPTEGIIRCTDTVTVRHAGKGIDPLRLKISSQHRVEKVILNGEESPFKRVSDAILLETPKLRNQNEVIVGFSGRTSINSEFSRLTPDRAVLREEEILLHGSFGYETVRLAIVVPQDWQAIASGRLEVSDTVGDSTTFVWVSDQPIPRIGWICAGKYIVDSRRTDSVEFSTYLFAEDSSSSQQILGLSEKVTNFYSTVFSPYRFPKLAIVEVEDWLGGPFVLAAAIPSMILVKQSTFSTEDEFNKVQAILPHEIAHQWWPQAVYVKEEDAALLSEGISDYGARLYDEFIGTSGPRSNFQSHPFLHSLIMRSRRGKEVPLNRAADLRALPTHYLKAAYIHHMLREVVGDSTFYQVYREFSRRYRGKTAGMQEFQSIAEEFSGRPLGWFFNQWVKETGLPRLKLYNVKTRKEETNWVIHGRIRSLGYKSYTMPVKIGVRTETGIEETSVWIGKDTLNVVKNDLPFEVRTLSKPLSVVVDPYGDLLKTQKMPVRLSDLREPSSGLMIFGTQLYADRLLEMARRDSAELERAGWSIRIKPDSISTLSDYRHERVFLYGGPSMNSVASQIGGRFPMVCDDGRCSYDGKVFADTAIAVTQIIENPFQEQALLCWIIPLGRGAQPTIRPSNASAVITRLGEVIDSWTWDVKDEELEVELEI